MRIQHWQDAASLLVGVKAGIGSGCRKTGAVQGPRGPAPGSFHHYAALGSIGCQMLILRVSGIRKTARTKHTAGTAIG